MLFHPLKYNTLSELFFAFAKSFMLSLWFFASLISVMFLKS